MKKTKHARYNEDGLRVGRDVSHQDRLNEKHMRAKLHRKSFDIVDDDDEDEDDDLNPHWLYQDENDEDSDIPYKGWVEDRTGFEHGV